MSYRIWRVDLFALTLPLPIYRAGSEPSFTSMGTDEFQGWFFPSWRFFSYSDGRRERSFFWWPWSVQRWRKGR